MPVRLSYATNHPNVIVRALEMFREQNQRTVEQHCNIARLNKRTYDAWLSGRRNPSVDNLEWVTVRDWNKRLLGVLHKVEEYPCPRTGKKRYYAVVLDKTRMHAHAGDGATPFDAIVCGGQKAANVEAGHRNDEFSVNFEPELFKK